MQMEMRLLTNPEITLTSEEAAKLLGVTTGAVTRWLQAGHFPNAWRLNPHLQSRWRIPKSDVDAFIQLRRTQRGFFYIPTPPPIAEA